MKDLRYQIATGDKSGAPLKINQIVEMLLKKELSPADSICEVGKSDWLPIVEIDEVMELLKSNLKSNKKSHSNSKTPNTPTKHLNTEAHDNNVDNNLRPSDFSALSKNPMLTEWYILKGENKFGPFQYTEVIKMLQEKIVFEFDYVWKNGMQAWTRLAEVHDFKPEHIKKLQESLMPEIKNVFFRRKHPRIPFENEVVVHDNNHFWTGQVIELSQGGAGVIMENSLILPGQQLYVHFKSNSKLVAFNSICEVVSKKYIDGIKRKESPICYGLKFINISEETFEALQSYTKGMLGQKSA